MGCCDGPDRRLATRNRWLKLPGCHTSHRDRTDDATRDPAAQRGRGPSGHAALGVLVGHCWGIGHGYSPYTFGTRLGRLGLSGGEGLALFFALSGYLLTRLFVRPEQSAFPSVRRYLRHRSFRILPTWLFVLSFMLLVHADGVARRQWWRFPLLLQGFGTDTVIKVDAPAWSLAVEAQYYLLLPLFAVLLRRSGRTATVTLLLLGCGSLWLTLHTITFGRPTAVWRYGFAANFVYFVPGMALAVLEARTGIVAVLSRRPHPRAVLLLASLPFWLSYVFLALPASMWVRSALEGVKGPGG